MWKIEGISISTGPTSTIAYQLNQFLTYFINSSLKW